MNRFPQGIVIGEPHPGAPGGISPVPRTPIRVSSIAIGEPHPTAPTTSTDTTHTGKALITYVVVGLIAWFLYKRLR